MIYRQEMRRTLIDHKLPAVAFGTDRGRREVEASVAPATVSTPRPSPATRDPHGVSAGHRATVECSRTNVVWPMMAAPRFAGTGRVRIRIRIRVRIAASSSPDCSWPSWCSPGTCRSLSSWAHSGSGPSNAAGLTFPGHTGVTGRLTDPRQPRHPLRRQLRAALSAASGRQRDVAQTLTGCPPCVAPARPRSGAASLLQPVVVTLLVRTGHRRRRRRDKASSSVTTTAAGSDARPDRGRAGATAGRAAGQGWLRLAGGT